MTYYAQAKQTPFQKKIQTYHNKWVVNRQNKRGHLNDVERK